jgi:apolipoprotein D and lipocalin family protein
MLLTGILSMVVAHGCATSTASEGAPPLKTVDHVDLERYLGTWYEIASYPQRFQKGCTGTTANYSLADDGDIVVLNQCYKGSLDGKLDRAKGRARVVDEETNAKLEVSFFRPFWGDYWIIDLGQDYDYAVVGHPDRDYLWILSREPQMDSQTYDGILQRLEQQHYDISRLEKTLQPET